MGSPKTPPMPAPPAPPPSVTAMEAAMARRDEQRAAANRKGMASTVLAGAASRNNNASNVLGGMPGQGAKTTLGG